MINEELLARINELARKKRTEGLTEEELSEQRRLYDIYLAAIRGQVIDLLDRVEFVDEETARKSKTRVVHQATINLGERVYH